MQLKDMLVTTETKTHLRWDKVHKDLLSGIHPCQEAEGGGIELALASLADCLVSWGGPVPGGENHVLLYSHVLAKCCSPEYEE